MLRIAGQTAGPIGLNFFLDTHGWPGGAIGFKFLIFQKKISTGNAGPSSVGYSRVGYKKVYA